MRRAMSALLACALLAGCGGAGSHTTSTTKASTTTATTPISATAQLEQGVRHAITLNSELSNWVLWHNIIPTWAARSTGGPALTALRSAAAARRHEHLQMLGVSPQFRVVSITLSPSFTQAVAVVLVKGEVRPYRHGKLLGHAIKVNEKAQLDLRRTGTTSTFVVWKVGAA
jgi:uncharacterized protein YceK